ncbi:sugar-transfer associated ATP-grasp domain-containing protein [uncultured Merdimonas sp.]|uniref:sugar-transfer associated ATP-grasp domain-containing protein n=1 Tax=uncultured Merdimonas sp. TaxID=2023269 RepID=UPI00320B8059
MNEHQRLMGYTTSNGIQYIILHIKKYNLLMKTFISSDLKFYQKAMISFDFAWSVFRYGVGINDYFQYNFYRRKAVDRKSFIVARNRKQIIKIFNGSIKQPDFDDKCRFNKIFNNYLGRSWIDLDECSEKEFNEFVMKNDTFMAKIKEGSGGNGIELISADGHDLSKLYKECKRKHIIAEEIIHQHKEMGKFNPKSVNTLRVITLVLPNNEVKIMDAVFRCGNGEKCTDNFHHFGMAAIIDPETGVVITPAVDKLNRKFYIHPKSHEQIIGFNIPFWNQVVDVVKKAAMVRKNVKFVGWDIAIKDSGEICIVEGNCTADPDITQMPDQVGKWYKYKKVLEEVK